MSARWVEISRSAERFEWVLRHRSGVDLAFITLIMIVDWTDDPYYQERFFWRALVEAANSYSREDSMPHRRDVRRVMARVELELAEEIAKPDPEGLPDSPAVRVGTRRRRREQRSARDRAERFQREVEERLQRESSKETRAVIARELIGTWRVARGREEPSFDEDGADSLPF